MELSVYEYGNKLYISKQMTQTLLYNHCACKISFGAKHSTLFGEGRWICLFKIQINYLVKHENLKSYFQESQQFLFRSSC
jgi:hypothetical protein